MSKSERNYTREELIELMAVAYRGAYEDMREGWKEPDTEDAKTVCSEILDEIE